MKHFLALWQNIKRIALIEIEKIYFSRINGRALKRHMEDNRIDSVALLFSFQRKTQCQKTKRYHGIMVPPRVSGEVCG